MEKILKNTHKGSKIKFNKFKPCVFLGWKTQNYQDVNL